MRSLFPTPIDFELGSRLAAKIHRKYAPAFEKMSPTDRAKAALFFAPHTSRKEELEVTRPRVVKWFCPFADQRVFPSGHRYCVNVYTGCEHVCEYCYVNGYSAGSSPKCKENFRRDLQKDLDDLEAFDVPCAPIHLSNSTDAFQPIEERCGDAQFALERFLEYRHRFSTVTLLTKNPEMLIRPPYRDILQKLNRLEQDHPRYDYFRRYGGTPLRVEISLAFENDAARRYWDPAAPSVQSRKDAIVELRRHGIPISLRIDPLFPRDPLPGDLVLERFGLPDVQPLDDLQALAVFARDHGVKRIVYSVLKLTRPRVGTISEPMRKMKTIYEMLSAPEKPDFRGGSWRLPQRIAQERIVTPLLNICEEHGLDAMLCKVNLLETR